MSLQYIPLEYRTLLIEDVFLYINFDLLLPSYSS